MATILVTGAAGGLAQLVVRKLVDRGDTVVAVDYRRIRGGLPPGVPYYKASYNKRSIEDVFRKHSFDTVLHLGRVGNLREELGTRFDLNVVGTQKIMNLCLTMHVKRMVVLSTFHIYGAHPANHTPIDEDDPLRAGLEFPEIADAIQLDNMATTWVWRHPEVSTVVLRCTNVVGPHISNTMSQFLRQERVPYLLGFNPMVQFIHEDDLAEAIVASADGTTRGVFNVAGADIVPWRTILKLAGARVFPLPSTAVSFGLIFWKLVPRYMVNFFKYPCVISDDSFRKAFNWRPRVDLQETIWATVSAARAHQQMLRENKAHRRSGESLSGGEA